jgi:hypothetical protein
MTILPDPEGAHGMQVNRANGANLIACIQGLVPSLPMVTLDTHPSTPNQRLEAAVVWAFRYLTVEPDSAKAAQGLDRCVELLHLPWMAGETLTDSHMPIWLRAMCGLRLLLDRAGVGRGGWSAGALLVDLVDSWFEGWYAVHTLGRVPSGPRAGQIILPCARKTVGIPNDAVRDAFYSLSTGGGLPASSGLSRAALVLDKNRQDTAALAMVKMIPSFGKNYTRGTLPKMESALTVLRGKEGHVAHYTSGPMVSGPDPSACWVEYSSGKYWFGRDEATSGRPFPATGTITRVESV